MSLEMAVEPTPDPIARLTVLVRVKALAKMGEFFGERVGLSKSDIDSITKAIERKLLRRVEVLLYDASGTCQGLAFFGIDWRKHEAVIQTGDKVQALTIDLSKPLEDQLDKALARFIDYINAQIRIRKVTRRQVFFSWRADASNEVLEAFRNEEGMVLLSSNDREDLAALRKAQGMGTVGNTLGESSVGANFRHQDTGDR